MQGGTVKGAESSVTSPQVGQAHKAGKKGYLFAPSPVPLRHLGTASTGCQFFGEKNDYV